MTTPAQDWAFDNYLGLMLELMNPDLRDLRYTFDSLSYLLFEAELTDHPDQRRIMISGPNDTKPSVYLQEDDAYDIAVVATWEGKEVARRWLTDKLLEEAEDLFQDDADEV